MNLFNEQSKSIPIDEFRGFVEMLDRFRSYYSPRAIELANELETNLKTAIISYIMASQRVYEWCGLIVPRLESYFHFTGPLAISTKAQAKMQQDIIIRILERGSLKMAIAHEKLVRASEHFSRAYGSITALVAQLNIDVDPNGDFIRERAHRLMKTDQNELTTDFHRRNVAFRLEKMQHGLKNIQKHHEEFRNALEMARAKINETKMKLRNKILALEREKFQAKVSLTAIDDIVDVDKLNKTIEKEIKSEMRLLINESRKYQERHADQKASLFHYIQTSDKLWT